MLFRSAVVGSNLVTADGMPIALNSLTTDSLYIYEREGTYGAPGIDGQSITDSAASTGQALQLWNGWSARIVLEASDPANIDVPLVIGKKYRVLVRARKVGTLADAQIGIYNGTQAVVVDGFGEIDLNTKGLVSTYLVIDAGTFTADWASGDGVSLHHLTSTSSSTKDASNSLVLDWIYFQSVDAEVGATLGADWSSNLTSIPYDEVISNADDVVLGFNPAFAAWWSGTYPDGWQLWAGSAPIKETTIVRVGDFAAKWIWVGSNPIGGGLAKFDGTNWTVYDTDNSGLPDNHVEVITIDNNGNKWIGTYYKGFAKFDGTNWTVYNINNSGLSNNNVRAIAIDNNDNKWIGGFGLLGGGISVFHEGGIVSVKDNFNEMQTNFKLTQNYPNPFNPSTIIKYSIPKQSLVKLKIYDILGREVATLVNKEQQPGNYNIEFNASNLSSGIYFYLLQAGSFVTTKKMILLR